jgi:hypothetical protein
MTTVPAVRRRLAVLASVLAGRGCGFR